MSRNQQLASVHVLHPSLLRLYISPLHPHNASPSATGTAVAASGAFAGDAAGASRAGGLNCGVQNVKRGGEGEVDAGMVYLVAGRQYSAWAEVYAAEMPHRPILITKVGGSFYAWLAGTTCLVLREITSPAFHVICIVM